VVVVVGVVLEAGEGSRDREWQNKILAKFYWIGPVGHG
jgi:CTP:molybdopterin cytidylyltransferase MocA